GIGDSMNVFGHTSLNAAADTLELLYTCPVVSDSIDVGTAEDIETYAQQAVTQTQVTSIIVCNYDGTTAVEFDIAYTGSSADTQGNPEFRLFFDNALAAETTVILNPGLVMAPGNEIWVKSHLATTAFTINYIEIT
ncbi:unnamed protein product, partial [marine sediment metagenome]